MQLKDCLSLMMQARQNITSQWGYFFLLATLAVGWLVIRDNPVQLTVPLKIVLELSEYGRFTSV